MGGDEPVKAVAARRMQGIETEGRILGALHFGRETTPAEIARRTGLTRSCVNHALRRMEKKGYIEIRKKPNVRVISKPLKELVEALERAESEFMNWC